ncbi:MAG: N-methyl-L-tryptophan oxidase [Burkholderiales bacterium]|nr:N-methyl-L-tryptophan oxidase [Burkholderiales bacterium]
MNPTETADAIVIGLGAFGSATAWQLARRGARVVGIDRFTPPHPHGSTHGETRITRLAVGEGAVYVPLVKRSHEIWAELEAMANGRSLHLRTGGIVIGAAGGGGQLHGKADFVQRTIDLGRAYGIPHEVLRGQDITRRFPQFVTSGDELAYYEPDSGVLRPEACVAAQLEEARRHGADLRLGETVLALERSGSGVSVRTDRATYAAAQVIVTAGAWIPGLVGGEYASRLKVMRQVLLWFRPSEPALYESRHCPVFIWTHGAGDEDMLYGFPMMVAQGDVKVAAEQFRDTTDPDRVDRTVTQADQRAVFDAHIAGRLRGMSAECTRTATCLYTVSPDGGFVIDRHPTLENVTVVSACSGHGFKHSAALGEQLALRALGEGTSVDWQAFGLTRP